MTYQVLARKYRPQDFSSLIGQQAIVTALRNALGEGRIAQAYLFSGIRGVGKTTAARLLAKALNCVHGPTAEPCNECTPCREITAGSDLDVLEVDAATYSKVEQVRELTESLRYGAARDRYKVVVLDEIHRLSRQAFDALLKIVEEPPAHLVFVFATTEAEAVPATILSRCQEFHFRRVPSDVVAQHLRDLCEREGITASDAALRLLARAGEGSVRDAVALLDQLATFGAGTIEDEDAARLLGGLDARLLHELLAAVLAGRSEEVSRLASRLEEEGWDPRHVFSQFVAYCRDGLHLALAGGGEAARERVDLPAEETAALAALVAGAGYENLLRLLGQLLAGEPLVRRSENGYIAAEVAWLRAAELPKLVRVEELLGGGAPEPGARSGPAGGPPAAARRRRREEVEEERKPAPERPAAPPAAPEAAPRTATPRPAESPAAAAAEPAPGPAPPDAAAPPRPEAAGEADRPADAPSAEGSGGGVGGFLDEVRRLKEPLAAHLERAALDREGDRLVIRYSPDDQPLARRVQREANREALDAAVRRTWGDGARWEARADGSLPAAAAAEVEAAPPEVASEVTEHPTVQTVLQLFEGQIESVEEREDG